MSENSNQLLIGDYNSPSFSFGENSLIGITMNSSVSVIGDDLGYDALEATIYYTGSGLESVEFGTPVFYSVAGGTVQKFYVEEVYRTAKNRYFLSATSIIGVFDKEKFFGGIYNGETLKDVVTDIMTSNGVQLYKAYSRFQTALASGETLIPGAKLSENYYGYADINSVLHAKLKFWSFDWQASNASSSYLSTDTVLLGAKGSDSGTRYYLSLYVRRSSSSERYTTSGDLTFYHNGRSINLGQVNLGDVLEIEVRPFDGKLYFTKNGSRRSYTIYSSTTSNPIPIYVVGAGYSTNERDVTSGFLCDWYFYKVYNGLGEELINAVALKNKYTGEVYIKNLATGYTTAYSSAKVNDSDVTRIKTNDIAVYSASDLDYYFNQNVAYSDGIDSILVYGWIPITTKRNALHQLLFSQNINLLQSNNGAYLLTRISTNSPEEISDDNVYDSGSQTIQAPAKSVSVTEHSYSTVGASQEKVFDNSGDPAISGEYIAVFQHAPISGVPVGNGLTVLSYNCNAAIVSGRGSILATPYTHSTAELTSLNTDVADGNDVSASNVPLVTAANSDAVMNKLKAWYFSKLNISKSDILYNLEKCGITYAFITPFSERSSGILRKVSIIASAKNKAKCEFVSGYTPPDVGGYSNWVILTNGSSWQIPQEVLSETNPTIRLNLIGKGSNGTNGASGESGTAANNTTPGTGGAGGAGGAGGDGGRILSATVDASQARQVSVVQQGENIVATVKNSSGGTISTYSSANGNVLESGFINIFNGERFAYKGVNGTAGGKGGNGGYHDPISHGTQTFPEDGQSVNGNSGGTAGKEFADFWYEDDELRQLECGGSGGGGASYFSAGGDAIRTATRPSGYSPDPNFRGGDGANGGNAEQPVAYGCGGNGGHGGGGGGGAEVIAIGEFSPSGDYRITYSGTPGSGGAGGIASLGVDGCLIIYY